MTFFSIKLRFLNQNTLGTVNVQIDYNSPLRKLGTTTFGMDVSGYGSPNTLANDSLEQQKLKKLGIKYMRMDLKFSVEGDITSKIVCAGNGCDTTFTGDQWIQAIKAIGAQPIVIVHYNQIDAVNMVKHFNKDEANTVHYWLIGNEPDLNGVDVSTYSNSFNHIYDAMKAIDNTIHIGGGTTAWYDAPFLQTFLQLCGNRVDFIDFHDYAQKGDTPGSYTKLFQAAAMYGTHINDLRTLIQKLVPHRADSIGIEVGEWQLNWGGSAQDNTNFHALWAASAMGHILSAGGHSLFYADKDNAFYSSPHTFLDAQNHNISVNVDDTNPAYHGIGMFTGEGLFPGFGDIQVQATTTLPGIEVYASNNPKNIVIINKNPSRSQTLIAHMQDVDAGTVTIWRKDEATPFPNPPTSPGITYIHSGTFSYELPPFSITTFVVNSLA